MVYVASSWRNPWHEAVVDALRTAGHETYDFRHPRPGENGFHWSEIDPLWRQWTPAQFRDALKHPLARGGFKDDYGAMLKADTFVLVLPSGRSSHLEMGWATGVGVRTAVLLLDGDTFEPELMYSLADVVITSVPDLLEWLHG